MKYEFLKVKRLRGLHLVYVFPLLMSGIALMEMLKRISLSAPAQIIPSFSTVYFQFYVLFSPLVIALILFSLIQVENKNKMWESSILLPIGKGRIYLGKVLISVVFILSYCIISYLFYMGILFICKAFYPEMIGINHTDNIVLIIFFSRIGVSLILYASLLIPVFIYIDSVILALGTFLFFITLSLFLTQKSWYFYYPFSYHLSVLNTFRAEYDVLKDKGIWVAVTYASFAFVLGMFLFKKLSPGKVSN